MENCFNLLILYRKFRHILTTTVNPQLNWAT